MPNINEARAVKKSPAKKAHTQPTEIHLQVGGVEYNCLALVEKARADYRLTHKTGIHSCKIYIKPEEKRGVLCDQPRGGQDPAGHGRYRVSQLL